MRRPAQKPKASGPRSDKYLEFNPGHLAYIKKSMEKKGKFSSCWIPGHDSITKTKSVPLTVVERLLNNAISIVQNTEEYTEYLLLDTFGDLKSYKKTPPGTIRIYSPSLFCFFNGRCWRKLK